MVARTTALQSLSTLPPLSAVSIQLQRLTEEDADMRAVAGAISADPALSADVLRLANSALFGARHTVPGILHAIVMLGMDRVKALAFTAAFMRFASPNSLGGAMKRCWRHSVACALIADELASKAYVDRDAAYTGGLLHDIGRLAMLRLWPAPYTAILDTPESAAEKFLERERDGWGVPHTEAGALLLKRWQLPDLLVAAAAHHHDAEPPAAPEPAGIVRNACALADAVGFPAVSVSEETRPVELPPILQEAVSGGLDELQFRVASRMNALEVWL